jgi:uncharacterized protein YktA (UPF0223 family)
VFVIQGNHWVLNKLHLCAIHNFHQELCPWRCYNLLPTSKIVHQQIKSKFIYIVQSIHMYQGLKDIWVSTSKTKNLYTIYTHVSRISWCQRRKQRPCMQSIHMYQGYIDVNVKNKELICNLYTCIKDILVSTSKTKNLYTIYTHVSRISWCQRRKQRTQITNHFVLNTFLIQLCLSLPKKIWQKSSWIT